MKHHFYMEFLFFNIEDKEITVFFAEKRNNYLCLNIDDKNNCFREGFCSYHECVTWQGRPDPDPTVDVGSPSNFIACGPHFWEATLKLHQKKSDRN